MAWPGTGFLPTDAPKLDGGLDDIGRELFCCGFMEEGPCGGEFR